MEKIKRKCMVVFYMACFSYVAIVLYYNMVWLEQGFSASKGMLLLGAFLFSFNKLIWLGAILDLSYKYLNRNSKQLTYLSDAVYPYYILHQTIIIVIGCELFN